MTHRRAVFFAATAGAVIVADQVTKALIRHSLDVGESVPVIDGILWFTRVQNTGGAFGVMQGRRWIFVGLALAVLTAIWWVVRRGRAEQPLALLGLALIAGGTVGNVLDRVVAGSVTDFIDFGWFPVFNVADMALDIGVALVVVWLLFGQHAAPEAVPEAGADGDGGSAGVEAPSP